LASTSARATIYDEYDPIDGVVLNATKTTHAGSFDLTGAGFTPTGSVLHWAAVEFLLFASSAAQVNIYVGSQLIASPVSGATAASDFLTGAAFDELAGAGTIDYLIQWVSGAPVTVSGASIFAENSRVPDGGLTVTLLGAALLGLGWARSKFKS
jgi:hypothetical protein